MAKSYKLGDLQLDVKVKENSSINKFTKEINNLESALNALGKVNVDKVANTLQKMSKLKLDNLSNAFKPLDSINTSALNSISKAFNSISKLSTTNFNLEKIRSDMIGLGEAVQPFIDKLNEAGPNLMAFSNALDFTRLNSQLAITQAKIEAINKSSELKGILNDEKIETQKKKTEEIRAKINLINQNTEKKGILDDLKIQKANLSLEKTRATLNKTNQAANSLTGAIRKLWDIGKLLIILNTLKRIGMQLGKIVGFAIDYEETLNKFQVAMGDYYGEALEFTNDLTRAFNLSSESIMNYQATFKNMLSSLEGLSEKTSYNLSQTLTRMAIDYASLFNVSIDTAMTQFQSALSGQVRAIRSTSGFDVTQTTLEEIYKSIEGTSGKSVRQLSQLEKRLLVILAIQKQMSETGSIGDFEKTIGSSANMLKQMSETLKEIGKNIGQIVLKWLYPVFERVLGLLVAVREISNYLKVLSGYEPPNYEQLGNTLEEAESSVEDILDDTNAIKRSLLGLDKLNILGSSSSNTDSAMSSDLEAIEKAIGKYSGSLDNVKNRANDVAKSILSWLGFIYDANTETWKLNKNVDGTKTNFEKIVDSAKTFGIILGSSAILGTLSKIIGIVTKIGTKIASIFSESGGIGTALSSLTGPLAIVAIIITSLIAAWKYSEMFRKSISNIFQSLKKFLTPILKIIKSIFSLIKPLLKLIGKTTGPMLAVAFDLLSLLLDKLTPVLEYIANFIDKLTKGIGDFITVFAGMIEDGWKLLTGFVKILFSGKSLAETITELEKLLFETLSDATSQAVINFFKKIGDAINDFFKPSDSGFKKGGVIGIGIGTTSNLPMYAKGGVVREPTTALIGEYSNAKRNPEIVSPVNLMSETFTSSILPLIQAVVNGDNRIVNAINEKDNSVVINGRRFYEETFNDLTSVASRHGRKI